ncbi:RagB/SusD family nutrient uptake outer membrane protein [Pedobacter miscanthi]|uniref:RagB/SusD family nutrient uptake outer membrane protein n=1 Tax=Pedobacter miscanthi TaxID=2259170 RepID=UPI00292D537E|nr:RagB/SusD family nutrient uptake outer membrane protein [Pedobacter miscanthi]
MKYIYQYIAVLAIFLVTGCDKFLDVEPKGKQLLQTVKDYDLWLNSQALTYETHVYTLYRFSDIYDIHPYNLNSITVTDLQYRWALQFEDPTLTPSIWSNFYNIIYYYNAVINGIDNAQGGSAQEKQKLKAEALLGRAHEYFYLVNLYGKIYNPSTADQDLSVPFVSSSDIVTITPPRSTVKQAYENIIADLNMALASLPADNATNRFRGSVAAANSMLARVYFYMRDYANARKYAELSLQAPSLMMLDYNAGVITATGFPNWPALVTRKDVIYARGAGAMSNVATVPVTLSFAQSFAAGDLRSYFIKDINKSTLSANPKRGTINYCYAYLASTTSPNMAGNANIGTSVAEMKLIIAEGAVRSGDLTTALQQLDDVRKNRFSPTGYAAFQSGDQAAILQKITDERLFELPFGGVRWLDMRRLSSEGKMPAVNRYDANGNVFETLQPNDPRYVLKIPLNILGYNPDMPQNQ